ncbi:hypothetical protein [Hymenobacter jeollabukensis]|uniref:Uncharacterized protein n=1 Tax=Hymenobacter jeollabukensis TaxID=2025313 RepID=A0A5R8WV66_9BACT|nr:hypothetical protein [Hymenobacter jeollabukensis]TLM95294.1 hypothetical protein FDY95_05770 [Hymenobacter jeollabukensis]
MLFSASPGLFLYLAHAALCVALAVGLTWQAWRHATGPRRAGRLVAGWLAAAALWLSVYPLQHRVASAEAGAAIVLTPGYFLDSVRNLRRRLGPLPLLRYRPATQPGGDTQALTSLPSLRTRYPDLRRLHVLGTGLPVADVPALPAGVELVSHPATAGPQFTAAAWNQQLLLGETLRLEGHFRGAGSQPVWVRLSAAGRPLDSVRLPAAGGSFTVRYQPRYVGQQLIRLEARQGRALLAAEPVPLQVLPARRLRVLILAGTPSFELNLLKNHLARRGQQVALRLRLSRGLLQSETQNQPATDVATLTPALLRCFDAVVTDADGLNGLTTTEAQALAAAAVDGLGVVLIGTTELPRSLPGRADFVLQPRPATQAEQPQAISWEDNRATAALPAVLRPTPNTRTVIAGPTATAVAVASRRTGWGTVLVSTPASTYPWLLSGATARYDSYWRTVLGAAARPLEPAARWQLPRWPRPDEPQLVQLTTHQRQLRPSAIITDGAGLTASAALRQLPTQSDVWQGTYWPARAGWHTVAAPGQDTAALYVVGPADWQGPLRAQRAAAAAGRNAAAVSAAALVTHTEPWVPAGWFFALFVVAAGWLWLDEKR